jgi:hypothetical protein
VYVIYTADQPAGHYAVVRQLFAALRIRNLASSLYLFVYFFPHYMFVRAAVFNFFCPYLKYFLSATLPVHISFYLS